jgi:O-antigen/teichoic acid export membrane protein
MNALGTTRDDSQVCMSQGHDQQATRQGNDNKWLARSSLVSLNGSLAGRAIHLAGQIALARFLGPAGFGLYAIGWSLFRVGSLFTPLGLDNGVIHCATHHAASDPRRQGKFVQEALVLAILFGAVTGLGLCIAAPVLAHRVFAKDGLVPVIYLFAAAFPLAAGLRVAAASTTVSQSQKYKVYAEQLTQPTINLALLAGLYLLGFRLLGAVAAAVISHGVALGLAVFYEQRLFPQMHWRSLRLSRPIVGDLLQFSTVTWLGFVFINLIPWVDRLFVGAYLTPADVGVYQAAAQTAVLFGIVGGAFNDVAAPRISLHFRDSQMGQVRQVYSVITKWTLYASVPFFLLFFFVPDLVLKTLYGSGYAGGAWTLIILSGFRLIRALAGPLGILLIFTARQKLFAILSAGAFVLSVILSFLLVPRFGAVGAALASGLASTAWLLGMLVAAWHTLGLRPYDRRLFKGILAGAAAAGTLLVVRPMDLPSPHLSLLFTLALSIAVFTGGLLVLGLEEEDHELVRTLKTHLSVFARGV